MIDSPAGRQSLGGGAVPWQVRSHAAIALGLVNEPLAVDALLDVAAHSPAAQRELRTAAIVALGLMHNVRTPDIVKALLALLETPKLDSVVGAYIPTSLAKLGDASLVPHLLDLYRAHDTDQAVRQSLAIALGRLGHLAQDPVVDALMDSVLKESDAGTRHFATMALGRLGADAADRELPVARRRLETFLQRQVSTPSHRTDVGWSALALAIDARASNATRSTLTDTLVEGYGNERDPSVRGAFALALGLAGAQAVAPQLLDEFRSSSDEAFRGYAAIALGLLRHQDAAAALIPLCGDKTVSDTFRQQVVRGVSLLDAPELTPVLLDALTQARSLPLAWSLGRALGQRRDADSIEPLEKLLADGTRPLAARAFACVALGLVGDKEVLRFNSDIAQDCNYLVRTATMDDILSL